MRNPAMYGKTPLSESLRMRLLPKGEKIMKKIFSLSVFGIFLLGLLITSASSQNAKIILERVIEAQGGRELLENIKDSTVLARGRLVQLGMSGTAEMYSKEPNKERLDIEVRGVVITVAFDGEIAWMTNPQTGIAEEMPGKLVEVVRKTSIGYSAFLHPEKYGISYNFKGKKSIGSKDYLLLERIYSDGYTVTFYINPNTYLIYKIKYKTFNEKLKEVEAEMIYSDYKNVTDIMTPHSITTFEGGNKIMILTVTEVAYNSGLEDSVFEIY